MTELINKDKLIDWSYREPTYSDSMNDRTDMRDFINSLPTTTKTEIRNAAVDEFVKLLKEESFDGYPGLECLSHECEEYVALEDILKIAEQFKKGGEA